MTIREQMSRVVEGVQAWARENKGSAKVAGDVVDVLDMFKARPGGVMAAVLWETEDPRGEHDDLGKVDRGFKVVISRGRGLKLDTGESLTDGSGGGKAMFDLAEECREVVRGLRFDEEGDDDRVPVYRGSGPFTVQGFVLDAYEVRFGIGAQIPRQE